MHTYYFYAKAMYQFQVVFVVCFQNIVYKLKRRVGKATWARGQIRACNEHVKGTFKVTAAVEKLKENINI